MTPILQANEGERLALGAPFAGELIVKTGGRGSDTLVLASHTLLRGTAWPATRYLTSDLAFFVHKGQGRVTVGGQSKILVPGVTVAIPRGVWHDLRNTGTGLLLVVWASPSSAVADFFREVSRAGGRPDLAALHAIGQRHGVEVRPPTSKGGGVNPAAPAPPAAGAAPAAPRRRRRHRGRGGRTRPPRPPSAAVAPPAPASGAAASAAPPAVATAPAPETPSEQTARATSGAGRPPRDRSDSGRGLGRKPAPSVAPGARAVAGAPPPRGHRGRSHGASRRRGRHAVKEVFMGGRWVRVSGEGPVISE